MSTAELPLAGISEKPSPEKPKAIKAISPHKDPGLSAAKRHVIWKERQLTHLAWGGLISGFTIAVLFLAGSVWMILSDHDVSGTIMGTVDLVGLVAVFIKSNGNGSSAT